MRMHTFGDKNNPAVIFIHGVWMPWQCQEKQIHAFKKKYYVIVPALNAHVAEEESEFISIQNEADEIERWLLDHGIDQLHGLCGLSMGGAIANLLFAKETLKIHYLLLDGAPLVPTPKFVTHLMTGEYKKLLVKMKERDPKTLKNAEKNFISKRYIPKFLEFGDKMTETSVENILSTVGESRLFTDGKFKETKILYLYGSGYNEYLSKKTAVLIKKAYPKAKIVCFKGYLHGQLMKEGRRWNLIAGNFFEGKII